MSRLAQRALALMLLVTAPAVAETSIPDLIAKMTLEQKVGQLFIVGYQGHSLNEPMEALIRKGHVGGFMLQAPANFLLPEELVRLTRAVQESARNQSLGIPLFLALDQEGGIAAPLHYGVGATPTPGNLALGASQRPEDARAAYAALGHDMAVCGVNVNFAPAIDALFQPQNPDYTVRSFSASVPLNAALGRAAVEGLQENGVLACAKHFPGLVLFEEDTHKAMPRIKASNDELWEENLAHFRAVIDAGTAMIMTCHTLVEAWDSKYPVTISKKIITGILREELGYDGVVITDSMGMGAILKDYGKERGTVLALEAGCDVILQVSRNTDELKRRQEAVLEAVAGGRLSEERIDTSVRRVLETKQRFGLFNTPLATMDNLHERLRPQGAVTENREAARNGVVLVRDSQASLPLPITGKRIAVVCPPSLFTRAGKGDSPIPSGRTLGHYVKQVVPGAVEARVDTVPSEAESARALEIAQEGEVLIIGVLLAGQSPEQVALVEKLLDLDLPTVLVGLGLPTDLTYFPKAETFLAAHGPAPINLEAAVSVLFGEAQPGGKLPMPVGESYPLGHSLKGP